MRHRIAAVTGLGNPDPVLLDNSGVIHDGFAQDALKTYFSKEEGFDFKINDESVSIGMEPAYQYERLKIIHIHKNKKESYFRDGVAWGGYGSRIASNTKRYSEYKIQCKFIRFVDKWHSVLFGE